MRHMKDYLLGRVSVTVLVTAMIIFGAAHVAMAETHDGKGRLGVMIEAIPEGLEEELNADFGVLVSKVTKDSPAEKGGIKTGDVIQYFDGEKIRRPSNLVDAVRETKPGTKAVISIVRDGKKKKVTAIVEELKPQKFHFDWKEKEGKDFKFVFKGRAYLGVHLHPLNEDLAGYFDVKAGEGALVLKVEEESPAHKAGVKSGDVIVKLGDMEIKGPEEAIKTISGMEKGEIVTITIIRHKKKKTLKAELEEMKGIPPMPEKGHWHHRMPPSKGYHYFFNDEEFKKHVEDAKEKAKKKMKKVKKEVKEIAEDSSI